MDREIGTALKELMEYAKILKGQIGVVYEKSKLNGEAISNLLKRVERLEGKE